MTSHIKQLLISLFALGIFYSNAAQAQFCTPTIYLFRHAEDQNGLTSVGRTHANLYPMMINQLQITATACAVQRVFAMWDRNGHGTENPYYTALPLAQAVGGMSYVPEMYVTDMDNHKYYLCEYPMDPPCEQEPGFDRNALSNSSLYSYLSAYFQKHTDASVAIFYTSQGMPAVSGVLGVFPVVVNCPNAPGQCTEKLPPTPACPLPTSKETTDYECYQTENRLLSWPGIQRSSVDIFEYSGNRFVKQYNPISTNYTQIQNLLGHLKFYQCFNFNRSTEQLSTEYYCQYSGILGNGIPSTLTTIGKHDVLLTAIKAKICYNPSIVANGAENPDTDSFGHCLP
jgi:hypothetical protein